MSTTNDEPRRDSPTSAASTFIFTTGGVKYLLPLAVLLLLSFFLFQAKENDGSLAATGFYIRSSLVLTPDMMQELSQRVTTTEATEKRHDNDKVTEDAADAKTQGGIAPVFRSLSLIQGARFMDHGPNAVIPPHAEDTPSLLPSRKHEQTPPEHEHTRDFSPSVAHNDKIAENPTDETPSKGKYGEGACKYLHGRGGRNICPMVDRQGHTMWAANQTRGAIYSKGKWVRNCDRDTFLSLRPEVTNNQTNIPWAYAYNVSTQAEYDATFTEETKYHRTCFATGNESFFNQKSDALNYYWQPDACDLHPFDPTMMREILTKNKILFVGDSLMGQLARSIRMLARIHDVIDEGPWPLVPEGSKGWYKGSWVGFSEDAVLRYRRSYILVNNRTLRVMEPAHLDLCMHATENGKTKIANVLNFTSVSNASYAEILPQALHSRLSHLEDHHIDTLLNECPPLQNTRNFAKYRHLGLCTWPKNLTKDIDVVVFNTGHHYRREGFDLYEKAIPNIVKYFSENFRGKIIYMSASPGHVGCDDHKEPILKSYVNPPELDSHEWDKVKNYEHLWGEAFSKSPLAENFTYFHVDGMTLLRPDGHPGGVDCLHHCSPGVTDTWAQALYNLFLQVL